MSGKYSNQTLTKINEYCNQLQQQYSRLVQLPDLTEHLNNQKNNAALDDLQKQGAENILAHLNGKNDILLYLQNITTNIDELLKDSDPASMYENAMESNLNSLLQLLSDMQDAAYDYFVVDDHDKTPKFEDPSWPYFSVINDIYTTGKNIQSVQDSDALLAAESVDEALKKEYKAVAAFSCDGTNLSNVDQLLNDWEKKLAEEQRTLNQLKNSQDEWEKAFKDAELQTRQIPDQIKQLIDRKDSLLITIEKDENDLETLRRLKNSFLNNDKLLNDKRSEVDKLNNEININQNEVDRVRQEAATYDQTKATLLNRAGSNKRLVKDYFDDREKELKWIQIKELSKSLQNELRVDSIAQTIVLSQIEKKAKSILGMKYQERIAGLPEKHLKQLEENALPETKNKIENSRKIVAQMMELALIRLCIILIC